MGNVSEIWASEMGGKPIGACTDIGQVTLLEDRILTMRLSDLLRPDYSRHKRKNHLDRILSLGFLPGEHYFNSGVLLMDCRQIRSMPHFSQLSTINKLIPYIHNLPDQDRLNEFFASSWYQFPLRWNVRPGIGKDVTGRKRKFRFASDNIRQQMVEAASKPAIWHYMGRKKPWINKWRKLLRHRQAYRDYSIVLNEFRANLLDGGSAISEKVAFNAMR